MSKSDQGFPFTESAVESATLTWLESLGWQVKHGLEIAPGTLAAERDDFGQVLLASRKPDCPNQLWESQCEGG